MSRFTPSPRCSRMVLISRFLPSRRPMVSQTLSPWMRSSRASIGAVIDAFDGDAAEQGVELLLGDVAVGAHLVAAQPARVGMGDDAGEAAVVGEEEQALGVDVEPPDRHDARQVLGQAVEHGRHAPADRARW